LANGVVFGIWWHVGQLQLAGWLLWKTPRVLPPGEQLVTKDRDPLRPSVSALVYSEDYYLAECEGYKDFLDGGISQRLLMSLSAISIRPGQQVLDIACGRGEAMFWLAERGARGWGIDYAPAALAIAQSRAHEMGAAESVRFMAANARTLPFADGAFDHALMLDVVEHLYPWELHEALREAHRVLCTGGRLIVHTAPNLWYYRVGYPAFRMTERLRGRRLPVDPKQRFRYHSLVHVNEQSPRSLRQALVRAGFRVEVWVDSDRTEWGRMGRLSRWAGRAATRLPLLKWVTCGDIFAIGTRD
jgi:ubiquinone/menaquinone biosynthesis C-methylase UbiE